MGNRQWILLFSLLLILCALSLLFLPWGSHIVGIWQRGELIEKVYLSTMQDPYILILSYERGESHIHLSKEGVWVEQADCRNQLCVEHGILRPGGMPIVCLPERIVISWIDDKPSLDAVSR